MSVGTAGFPRQKMPFSKKTEKWRKAHLDWADRNSYLFNSEVRRSLRSKVVNYDLYNGNLHEDDMKKTLNPLNKRVGLIPKNIQHYPIINNPINTLIGEEARRKHDFFVKVVNDEAVSEIERNKITDARKRVMEIITNEGLSEEETQAKVSELEQYYNYKWQDIRELRANWLLKHYIKELDFDMKLTEGFKDVCIASEEIYQFDISSGEPIMERLNPKKVYAIRSGYSSRIEDSDIIIIDDYWTPSRIIDIYYEKLKDKDVEYIESIANANLVQTDDMANIDERNSFIAAPLITEDVVENSIDTFVWMGNTFAGLPNSAYVDNVGNVRVLRIYWRSKRKIKKVKSYDPITGEENYSFKDETYKINPFLGEEEETLWINEWWEGTKIGQEVYINMRPKPVQYLRLSNPSLCSPGIVGQIYNTNQTRPVSILDRMKPYQYLYNTIKDRLNKTIAKNYGKILELDKARMPSGWDYQKWLYFIEQDNISVVDSFKEGNKGMATGKLAGTFNTTGRPLDLEVGNSIQMYINLLEYLKTEMYEISGVSRQRQGQIQNRETVGGVERAVSQSSYITEEMFAIHDNVRKRCYNILLETAKIALKGKSKKLQYITDDKIMTMLDIDGDEFSEMDYDVMVDNDMGDIELKQKLEQLAHAGLQNQLLSFSTIMKIFTDPSLSSIMRKIEQDETKRDQENQATREAQDKQIQAQIQSQERLRQAELDLDDLKNQRDNATKLQVALIGKEGDYTEEDVLDFQKLQTDLEQFNKEIQLKRDQLEENRRHNKATEEISRNKPKSTNSKK